MGQTGTSQAWGLVGCGREFGLHPRGSRETLKGLGFIFQILFIWWSRVFVAACGI